MKQAKVLIGLPTMGHLHTWLSMTLLAWVAQSRVPLRVYPTIAVQPVDNARNAIVDELLHGEASDCTHLLFIDSDTIPPVDGLEKLLAADKDIISGITPIIENDPRRNKPESECGGFYKKWNCVGMDDTHVKPNTGIVPIKGAGGSFILIKREVFEKLNKPYYRFLYQDDNGKETMVSEDIYFIIKAISNGYQPFADTSVICSHVKPIVWGEQM